MTNALPRRGLWLAGLALLLGGVHCSRKGGGEPARPVTEDGGGGGGGGDGGGDGGAPPGPTRCEADLTTLLGSGAGARATIATASTLLTGEAATGRPGDVLLENDRIRLVIEAPGRLIGPQPFGGNIIDADIVRPGEPARDRLGELGSFLHFGRTVDVERVEVLRDGAQGGAAVVAATGRDAVNDFIHLRGLVGQAFPGLTVPDADEPLGLRVTKYYVLAPGASSVQVVDAFCNDGDDPVSFASGDLVDSGGQVQGFAGNTGFGASSLASSAFSTAGEPFVGWFGDDVSYGLVPPDDRNAAVTIAGVTVAIFGNPSLLAWTRGGEPAGSVTVPAKGRTEVARRFVVSRDPGGVFEAWYGSRGVATVRMSGRVVREGRPVSGVRVAVVKNGRLTTLLTSDAQGRFEGRVPPGNYDVTADDGVTRSAVRRLTASAPAADEELLLPPAGGLSVRILDAAGSPMPGRATVVCEGPCAVSKRDAAAMRYRDARADELPTVDGDEVAAYVYLGPDGEGSVDVAPGRYVAWLSHGPEYGLARLPVEIVANGTRTAEARLSHVVDSSGWVSADFHVHAVNSPDSPLANVDRVRSFLAEGVDVLVATDHDVVTDLAPFAAAIPEASRWIRTVPGVELTTFDYGHFNAFPLVADTASRNGGAVDWAVAGGPGMTPGELFAALDAAPGEQVVQVNHARSGMFGGLELDTRTLWTRTPA